MHIDDEIRYRALAARDVAFRRPFLRRSDVDSDLLPADLHGPVSRPRSLPFLFEPGTRRTRRIPALPALPARAGARQCAGRCRRRTAQAAACRIEAGALNDGGSLDDLAGNLGFECTGSSALRQAGVWRLPDRAGPDAAAAAGQAVALRVKPADHPGCLREWFRERPSLQLLVSLALPADANRLATVGQARHGRPRAPHAGISPAAQLAFAAAILERPGHGRRRAGRRSGLPAYRGGRKTQRLVEGRADRGA